MKNDIQLILLLICCASMVAGGCANKEMVRKEETVSATAQSAAAANAKAKEKPVKAPQVQKPAAEEKAKDAQAAKAGESIEQINPLNAAQLMPELQLIYFDFDSALLSPAARATLAKNADLIRNSSIGKINIEGHCDERGSDEYNIALGERRANAASNYLVTMGVPADRFSIISYGEEKPVNPEHNEAAWAKNRRDEFVIVK